jgi:uncharacterized protein YraI
MRVTALRATVAAIAFAALSNAAFAAPSDYPYTHPLSGPTQDYTPLRPVFLRAGPTTDAPVIGVLRPGMRLRATASANYGWLRVYSPAGAGWAWGRYLTPG